MRRIILGLALLGGAATAARAQDTIPDLKGTWSGKANRSFSAIIPIIPARKPFPIRRACATSRRPISVEGQDGRIAWGHSSSAVADTKEPFAWAIASDNRSIVGADLDGYFRITLVSPDRMEKCYVHNGTGPSRSVVATCFMMDRVKR